MKNNDIEKLKNVHKKLNADIVNRLNEFSLIGRNGSDNEIFIELLFCLLTPQSKAKSCWQTIETLIEKDLVFDGSWEQISKYMNYVRFKNNKSKYIVEARKLLQNRKSFKDQVLGFPNVEETRLWLYKNVKGIGIKEASHFLRNIGSGENIAILDRHVLKNLLKYGVINEIPGSLTINKYLEIENNMREFSGNVKIPLSHLDIIFWYSETGEIFK
ncbi:N-glycosylase/DNA lyase [candidate division KSB1 bacterium]